MRTVLSPIAEVSEPSSTPNTMRTSLGKRPCRDLDDIGRTEAYDNDISMPDASPVAAEIVARPAPRALRPLRRSPRSSPRLMRASPLPLLPAMPPPGDRPGRIIAVTALTIYSRAATLLADLWSWLTTPRTLPPLQVYAIETTVFGNKRRAIAADDMTTEVPSMCGVPGDFPASSMVITPPDSRPTSSDSKEHNHQPAQQSQDALAQSQQPSSEAPLAPATSAVAPAPSASMAPATSAMAPTQTATAPAQSVKAGKKTVDISSTFRKMTMEENLVHLEAERIWNEARKARVEARRAMKAAEKEAAKSPRTKTRERRIAVVTAAEEKKDARIDGLIERSRVAKTTRYDPYITMREHMAQKIKTANDYKRAKEEAALRAIIIVEAEEERAAAAKEEARLKAERIAEAEEALRREEMAKTEALRKAEEAEAAEIAAQVAALREAEEAQAAFQREETAKTNALLKAEEAKAAIQAAQVTALKEAEQAQAAEVAAEAEHIQAVEAEQAAGLIKPLSPEHLAKLNAMLEIRNDRHIVVKSPEGVELTRRDFGTLLSTSTSNQASAWFNDEIVNAYLSTIVSWKLEQDGYVKIPAHIPAFVAFNTAWHSTYKTKGLAGLASWSRRKAIKGDRLLRTDKIFFPINTGIHWMLLVISPQTHSLEFLDSMHTYHPGADRTWLDFGRSWLAAELGKEYKPDEWTESPAQSSLQTNGNDCGAFTCLNALASATGADFAQVTAGKMQEARRHIGAVLLNKGFGGIADL
ncbi:hypothetical protein LTR91_014323 [Friedmanniomyces endolithicus]|uniref:Ubiquitin-like protease family profile domain-containing protein n=1 Tax=Friedmanniomyces endolithicus TaxID=329885 RepID=A0AAN6KC50_9PEZI|nr:hypothetical protein LTR94_009625 [Friedmanniomyces endolithicus]KAK0770985.1 hypothetical protein LTR59_016271 [Friedmanniomyces endolithicus]KAK0796763.1 hypothetical protein LTR38_008445 [Friedmanniomyces endolithicus]KAK0851225.1 hypothetical protein LTS02_012901 [Friedmanniomyces endolithicus]KAK0855806.1 hypothetical protein LTR03_001558 [Friedmanniomyces endolithicus]